MGLLLPYIWMQYPKVYLLAGAQFVREINIFIYNSKSNNNWLK